MFDQGDYKYKYGVRRRLISEVHLYVHRKNGQIAKRLMHHFRGPAHPIDMYDYLTVDMCVRIIYRICHPNN